MATNNAGQELIHSFSLVEMWKLIEMVPGCLPGLDRQSAFIFPGVFFPGGRQNSTVKVRLTGNQAQMLSLYYSHNTVESTFISW